MPKSNSDYFQMACVEVNYDFLLDVLFFQEK